MKNNLLAVILFIFLVQQGFAHEPRQDDGIRFIENKNQWDSRVLYKAEITGGAMFLEKNCFTYNFRTSNSRHPLPPADGDSLRYKGHAFQVKFLQANAEVLPASSGEFSDYTNYFIGKDPSHWASYVKAFATVLYEDIYEGVDLKVYSQANNIKYDFILYPKTDPSIIRLQYTGLDRIAISEGNLLLVTSVGVITEQKPFAYQYINGELLSIPCEYRLEDNVVSFAFPAGYNQNYPVTIDPVLIFSTYSGSTADNFGYSAAPDSKGFLYSGSSVFDIGYPVTPGAYQTTFAGGSGYYSIYGIKGTDVGITKYDTTGTKRIYSTYLGGNADEVPHSLIVNDKDELYIFGTTGSPNFPITTGAYDSTFAGGTTINMDGIAVAYVNGSDIFVSKLSNDGTQLLASTYIGGTGNDGILAKSIPSNLRYNYADELRGEIELDKSSNVYIASCTHSTDFPIKGNVSQPTFGGGSFDAIVLKMDPNLQSIFWSTYLGGSADDAAYSIELDRDTNIYVAGGTNSFNFPTTAGTLYPAVQGGRADGFIAFLDNATGVKNIATYFGSTTYDQIYCVGLDKSNNVHVFGQTDATGAGATRYIKNAGFSQPNSGQFITKIKPALDTVIWSTTFGDGSGHPNISPTAFLVDLCSKIYLSGWGGSPENNRFLNSDVNPAFKYPFNMYTTLGSSPPTDFYQPTSPDKADFYLFVIESDASAVSYASYFGGPLSMEHVDGGTSRFDRKGKIYQAMCAGCGGHTDMPIKPPFGATELPAHNNSSNCNIGVFKMDFLLPAIVADFNGNDVCLGDTTHFTSNSLKRSATDFLWKFGDGATSTLENPWHLYSSGGTYNVTLILSDSTSCNLADTIVKPVYVSPLSTANATADDSIICKGDQTTLRATPNSTAFLYSWTPALGLSNPQSAVTTAMPTVTTTYTVLIYDKKLNNCQASDTVTIKIQAVVADFNASDVCLGNTVYFTSNSSKLQATTFLWKFGDGATSTMENPSHLYNQPGTYNVMLIVSDPASCNGADTLVKPLYVSPISSSYSIDATADDYTIYKGKQTVLRAIPNTPGFSYSWTPTTGLSNPQSAVTLARPQITTTYTVAVSDPKLSSCRVGDTVTIQVVEIICREPYIYVPNAFTPNEDGKNELIYVRSKNVRDLYFTIYNRWGEKVFETKDQNIGWDGTYKGMKVDPGVFDYYVEGHCIDDQQFFMKGNITVIR